MITIKGIDHIVLNTFDKYQLMLDFYCQVLDCQIEREVKAFNLTQLRAGNALIDLVNTQEDVSGISNNVLHFCLCIEQPVNKKLIEYLYENSISSSEISSNYGAQGFGDAIYIKDPCDNIIELKQIRTN